MLRKPQRVDEPQNERESHALNDKLRDKSKANLEGSRDRDKTRELIESTHSIARCLIRRQFDPCFEKPIARKLTFEQMNGDLSDTTPDVRQIPGNERLVNATDVADLQELVRQGRITKEEIEKLLAKIQPVLQEDFPQSCTCAADSAA